MPRTIMYAHEGILPSSWQLCLHSEGDFHHTMFALIDGAHADHCWLPHCRSSMASGTLHKLQRSESLPSFTTNCTSKHLTAGSLAMSSR